MINTALASVTRQFDVTLTTTPKTLRELVGYNQLRDLGGRAQLGGKIYALSGNILWGATSAKCVVPFASADVPWEENIAPVLENYFAAAAGTVTASFIVYFA